MPGDHDAAAATCDAAQPVQAALQARPEPALFTETTQSSHSPHSRDRVDIAHASRGRPGQAADQPARPVPDLVSDLDQVACPCAVHETR